MCDAAAGGARAAASAILSRLPEGSRISSRRLQKVLAACVSPGDEAALRKGREGLVIGEDNRGTILRLLDEPCAGDGEVKREDLVSLMDALSAFLEKYMADRPEGHLWILLCCVYLSMVVGEPLHPKGIARWEDDGGVRRCPAREDVPGSLCRWCVCRPLRDCGEI